MSLILFGSGEFTDQVQDIDDFLIKKYKPQNIAILPTAAGLENDWLKWIDMAKNHYAKFNLQVIPLRVKDRFSSNQPEILKAVDQSSAIFISGGNPLYLFDQLQDTLMWAKIKQKIDQTETLVAGSSAGAMIMGGYILKRPLRASLSNNNKNWQKAFQIIEPTIFPHFDKFNQVPFFINNALKKSPPAIKENWIGIDENTAIIVEDNFIKLGLGNVTIQSGQTKTII